MPIILNGVNQTNQTTNQRRSRSATRQNNQPRSKKNVSVDETKNTFIRIRSRSQSRSYRSNNNNKLQRLHEFPIPTRPKALPWRQDRGMLICSDVSLPAVPRFYHGVFERIQDFSIGNQTFSSAYVTAFINLQSPFIKPNNFDVIKTSNATYEYQPPNAEYATAILDDLSKIFNYILQELSERFKTTVPQARIPCYNNLTILTCD